jgi:adenylosuccinate lyase
MKASSLSAISPVDGRYADKVAPLREIFSEFGLIRFRVLVEIRWLQTLAEAPAVDELKKLSSASMDRLNRIVDDFSGADAERVKAIESATNHDVKAIEYFIRERLGNDSESTRLKDFLHFACTSEDINNLAYALMLRTARSDVLLPKLHAIQTRLGGLAKKHAAVPMLSRTHGQTASPTTVGKEFANFASRLGRAAGQYSSIEILGKFNGAVGNFNAHLVAYPAADWPAISRAFIESLGLAQNSHTTQIEPHDWTAEYCHALVRCNTVLIDLARDIWAYISLGYFTQKLARDEVGSSTMPHKVNPIDFENAEGNLGMATALLSHFAEKLPVSRWQRDLTDSTVQRNFGVALAYILIAFESLAKGLDKLQLNDAQIAADIDGAWEVLAEAVQTVMRRHGIPEPYEKLKALTRGKPVNQELLHTFIRTLELPENERQRLLDLRPESYLGLAAELARDL